MSNEWSPSLLVKVIKKRDGSFVAFDEEKLRRAVSRTFVAVRGTVNGEVDKVVGGVLKNIKWSGSSDSEELSTDVEGVQDEVERQLLELGFVDEARAFISYRKDHTAMREASEQSKEVKDLAKESSKYFEGNPLGEFVYLRTYARWIDEENRRETWIETVDRYISFMKENLGDKLADKEYGEVRTAILKQEVMPSMRLLQFAGPAARRCNMVSFNCFSGGQRYVTKDGIKSFAETVGTTQQVLNKDGEWASAEVRPFGKQSLNKVTFRPGRRTNVRHEVLVTRDHRWLTENRGEVTDLAVGDKVRFVGVSQDGGDLSLEEYVRGIGYGDGTIGGLRTEGVFVVEAIEEDVSEEEVFCVVEPKTHSFVLEHGILTGNCSYIAPSKIEDFGEILYLSASGTGVGFSVETLGVQELPIIKRQNGKKLKTHIVSDSREGWADALIHGMKAWYNGKDVEFDYSRIRPSGTRLKTTGGKACLTGDTLVYKDRKKSRGFNEVSIADLYKTLQDVSEDKTSKIRLRALDESAGEFFRNRLVDVVLNGKAPVYEVVTENGYRIRATDNHRFMNDMGEYQELSEFCVGDDIAVNGATEPRTKKCSDCDTGITRRAKRCRTCADARQIRTDASPTSARQRKECRDALGDTCESCGAAGVRLVVHHEDENPHNNKKDNLKTLCEGCHRKHHFSVWTFGNPYSHKYLSYDKIVSIEYTGVEDVYDLVMEGPNHNFVANGFVSHNSGPGPLRSLLDFARERILSRQGRRLSNIDVHDIICKIGEAIVSGGVRRTAMISLSDLDDGEMKKAKQGAFYTTYPHRTMSNNSAVYNQKPSSAEFLSEWANLVGSGTGERGIFNRSGLITQLPKRRIDKWREMGFVEGDNVEALVGTNPCAEIVLLSKQTCNLSEVIARSSDDRESLLRKIKIATILGTYQSTLTNFKYLSPEWKENCDAERLLGVSITGQWDCKAVQNAEMLSEMRDEAVKVNRMYARRFGVNPSTAVTAVKPSGTVSQTVNCSSGMHPRHSEYYIRRIRISATDSLFKMLRDQGAPFHPEVGQTAEEANTFVIDFPVKAPEGSTYKDDISAIQQLEYWKLVKENYTEHNPSVTVSVGTGEWIEVADWVYKNWDIVGGLSFLPRSDHVYMLAPYEEITKEQYEELVKRFENVDYSKLVAYELQDETEMRRELACAGNGTCEIN